MRSYRKRNVSTDRSEFVIRSSTDQPPDPFASCRILPTDLPESGSAKWFRRRTAKTSGWIRNGFWNRWRKRSAGFRDPTHPTIEESWKKWTWIFREILSRLWFLGFWILFNLQKLSLQFCKIIYFISKLQKINFDFPGNP